MHKYNIITDGKSPYFFVTWTSPDGRRRKKSTKIPHGGGVVDGVRLTARQCLARAELVGNEIVNDFFKSFQADDYKSFRQVAEIVIKEKSASLSHGSLENNKAAFRAFCDFLGARADTLPVREITKATIKVFVAQRRKNVRASTVGKELSCIRALFGWLVDAELLDRNPCHNISIPPDSPEEKTIHEAFTLSELQRLMEVLPAEWQSAVICCLGTYGQRLSDIVSLKWEAFDFQAHTVRIVTKKTKREMLLPLRNDFFAWAKKRRAEMPDAIYVHPRLSKITNPSREFSELCQMHGFSHPTGCTQGNRRQRVTKTFHSIRATVATMLQAAGVSQGIAMHLVGHNSSVVHNVYIKPTINQLQDAAKKMPSIFKKTLDNSL